MSPGAHGPGTTSGTRTTRAEALSEGRALGEGDALERLGIKLGVAVLLLVALLERDTEGVSVGELVALGQSDTVEEPELVGVDEGVCEGVPLGDGVCDGVTLDEGVCEGVTLEVGVVVGV